MDNNPFFDLYIDEAVAYELAIKVVDVQYDEATGQETETIVDLSDITAVSALIKKDYSNNSPVLATFSAQVLGDPTKGEIALGLTDAQTAQLASGTLPVYQVGYYDIILAKTSGSKVKLIGGKVFINQTITI